MAAGLGQDLEGRAMPVMLWLCTLAMLAGGCLAAAPLALTLLWGHCDRD